MKSDIRPTENPLLVFISSAQEEFRKERRVCVDAIQSLVLTRPWAFEYAPASADALEASYLRKVDQCDIFVALIGCDLTASVDKEWKRATEEGKRRLVFVKEGIARTDEVKGWLTRVDVKYDRFVTPRELQERLLIALVDELIRGYREFRLQKEDYKAIVKTISSIQVSFTVRTIEAPELADVGADFPQIEELYPEVDKWLDQKRSDLARGEAEGLIAIYGLEKAGFALTSEKASGVRKISTLFVLPRFQGVGVGPRLLYDIISKSAKEGVEKLYITVAEERRAELEGLLLRYGFQLEGVAPRRYRIGSWEWVWGKRLIHGVLLEKDLHPFVRRYLFLERGFDTEDLDGFSFVADARFGVTGRLGGARSQCLVATAYENQDEIYRTAKKTAVGLGLPLVLVSLEPVSSSGLDDLCLDALDLETLFFPLLVKHDIDGLVIPIREQFVSRLIPSTQMQQMLPPSRVQLRTDNVYYRYPSAHRGLRRGSPLFFFETRRRSGASRLIGEAKLMECAVDEPAELFARFGNLGVYTLEQLVATAPRRGRDAGKVLALRFDWYREVGRELASEAIRRIVPRYDPTTARRIGFETALRLRRAAGWDVKELFFQ
jgi:GNAT superfamily N-acetyltransferase